MVVKNRLKEVLDERGVKSIWLANQVNVTKQTVSSLVNNRFNPSLELALKNGILFAL